MLPNAMFVCLGHLGPMAYCQYAYVHHAIELAPRGLGQRPTHCLRYTFLAGPVTLYAMLLWISAVPEGASSSAPLASSLES